MTAAALFKRLKNQETITRMEEKEEGPLEVRFKSNDWAKGNKNHRPRPNLHKAESSLSVSQGAEGEIRKEDALV